MPPPKSKVWLYFDRHIDGGKCNLCQSIIAGKGGNTTNLGVHLRRKHRIEIIPNPSVAGEYKLHNLSSRGKGGAVKTDN